MLVQAHLTIQGKVQGVYFRWSTVQQARQHNLTGWVRNRTDGSVEALLEGDQQQVAKVVKWCHKGPPDARVDSVKVNYAEATGKFATFEIVPTI
ncbi:MAG: acylphosphatase [Peptococcaceae bacterium]|nr:acylphosphatase [Peptococcaceae bacterium]